MVAKGIEYLRKKLVSHQNRVNMRYKQYSMKYFDQDVSCLLYTSDAADD